MHILPVIIYIYMFFVCLCVCLYRELPRDHVQTTWILVSTNLSLLDTSRTKWQHFPNVQILNDCWIPASKKKARMLVCALFFFSKYCILIISKRIQNNQARTYPTASQNVSKTLCAYTKNSIQQRTGESPSGPNCIHAYPTLWILNVSKADSHPKYTYPKKSQICACSMKSNESLWGTPCDV